MRSIKIEGTEIWVKNISTDIFQLVTKDDLDFDFPKLGQYIFRLKPHGLKNVIAATNELMLFCDSQTCNLLLSEIENYILKFEDSVHWKIPVYFETLPDWNHIFMATSHSLESYTKKLSELQFKVSMFGFIPGFSYLTGLPRELFCPRKLDPVQNMHGNVLAVGGPYMGIHCLSSPTGWNVLGKIPTQIIDLNQKIIMPFSIGDTLSVDLINKEQYQALLVSKQNIVMYNA